MSSQGIGYYINPIISPESKKRFGDTLGSAVKVGSRGKEAIISLLEETHAHKPLLIITPKQSDARKLSSDLTTYFGSNRSVMLFPDSDVLPFERLVVDTRTTNERLIALSNISSSNNIDNSHPILISSIGAALRKTLSPAIFTAELTGNVTLSQGLELNSIEEFLNRLVNMGYKNVSLVEAPGSFSHRGGIIDVYPPNLLYPIRIDLWDTIIETIKEFDVNTQRSIGTTADVFEIICAGEQLSCCIDSSDLKAKIKKLDFSNCNSDITSRISEELELLTEAPDLESAEFFNGFYNQCSLIDYITDDFLVILDRPDLIEHEAIGLQSKFDVVKVSRQERGELPKHFPDPYFSWPDIDIYKYSKSVVKLDHFGIDDEDVSNLFLTPKQYAGNLEALVEDMSSLNSMDINVMVSRQSFARLNSVLTDQELTNYYPIDTFSIDSLRPGCCYLIDGNLSSGWSVSLNDGNKINVLTDNEMFGISRTSVNSNSGNEKKYNGFQSLHELTVDSYVVHIDHGISKFVGLTTMNAFSDKEYLILEYAQEDKLYVPTDQLHRVSPFVGTSDQAPALTRLASTEWTKLKQKVKESAQELAKELLDVQVEREAHTGMSFPEDTVWQEEFEQSFIYTETVDQMQAIIEVKTDMQSTKPMDRLICGDVGYGKTEVALRAAFKVVAEGMQVAILVPTTVLAQQHLSTFSERLHPYSMIVDSLSRFRTKKEQIEVLEKLQNGTVDVVIGTHRLLQSDVGFKNLGLIVVDEEQRFGVMHKELLKKLRRSVDIISISATPIPRTLNMALSGIKDMSIMYTPPDLRLPVKTFACEYSEEVIVDAVMREIEREGQVFFVHNRVKTMPDVVQKLRELMPSVSFSYAHGRMNEDELESAMLKFAQKESDVLVCTTIIESGIDLPNVNTIILDRADRFGLSQMYQLRGRVGRGERRAYAYLMVPRGRSITENAERRIEAIMEASELGAGFQIAMRDLEIRGAGNILGSAQSGHIKSVGLELYSQILSQAVEDLNPQERNASKTVEAFGRDLAIIDLPVEAYIPDDYISHLPSKLGVYHRLSKSMSDEDVIDMKDELRDRFGVLPLPVEKLFDIIGVRNFASTLGVKIIKHIDNAASIGFIEDFGGAKYALQKALGPTISVQGSDIRAPLKQDTDILELITNVLTRLKIFKSRLERMV